MIFHLQPVTGQDIIMSSLKNASVVEQSCYNLQLPYGFKKLNARDTTVQCKMESLPLAFEKFELMEREGQLTNAKTILTDYVTDSSFCRLEFQTQCYFNLRLIQIQLQLNLLKNAKLVLSNLASDINSQNTNLSTANKLLELKLRTILNFKETKDDSCILVYERELNKFEPVSFSDVDEYLNCEYKLSSFFKEINEKEKALINLQRIQKRFQNYLDSNPTQDYHFHCAIASAYQDLMNYDSAKFHFENAEHKCISFFGINSLEYIQILRYQARLYRELGENNSSEMLLNKAIEIAQISKLSNTVEYNMLLLNLSSLYNSYGKRADAETLAIQAKLNFENHAMTAGSEYIQCLELIANIQYNEKRWDESELLLLKSNALRQQLYGISHYSLAENLSRLGSLYLMKEHYAKAESLYLEAIRLSNYKGIEMKYPFISINLGLLYSKTGQFEKAEKTLLLVKSYYETQFGNYNKTYLWILDNLAELYTRMNQYEKASQSFVEASKIRKRIIYDSFKYLSPSEVDGFIKTFKRGINLFNAFLINCPQPKNELLLEAYDNELFYKGFSLNYQLEVNNLIGTNKKNQELHDSLKSYCKLLSKEFLKSTPNKDYAAKLNQTIRGLEQRLCLNLSGYNRFIRTVRFGELKTKLKTGESVVEISYIITSTDIKIDSCQYIAFVFDSKSTAPSLIKLGSESQLTQLFPKSEVLKADYVNAIYGVASRGFEPIQQANANNLYQCLIQPLLPALKNTKIIYYAPSGGLHKINIQAIPVSGAKVFGQNFNVIQLASGRDLNHIQTTAYRLKNAHLFGGINYYMKDSNAHKNYIQGNEIASRSITGLNSIKTSNADWPELKHTQSEILQIGSLLKKSGMQVKSYLGSEASETQFNKLGEGKPSPDIIHLATHGYFISKDQLIKSNPQTDSFQSIKNQPMLRSGLILANGFKTWQSGPQEFLNSNDGVLTALEVSQMDLKNTKLVVLSACETGLGDINGNDGVLGLQRAFQIAGVKKIIMSLWEVPDYQTQELMQQFYKFWITNKNDIPSAFTKAQMSLKEKYRDPYFWAGFILVNY